MSKVLVIQHIACEGLGTFDLPLTKKGLTPSIVAPYKGDSLPENPEKFKAIIILGGPIGVYEQEKYSYLKDEIALFRRALDLKVPLLGICLGAQLLAAAAGATVYKGKKKEIGWYEIRLTKEGLKDPAFNSLPEKIAVFQWHGDTFDLPEGSRRLARSELFRNQAFCLGDNAYGLQFHLEVTEEMIRDWLSKYKQEIKSLKNSIAPDKIISETREKAESLANYAKIFLQNFLKLNQIR